MGNPESHGFYDFNRFGIGIDVYKQFSIVNVYSNGKKDGIEYIYDKTNRFEMTLQGLFEMESYLKKFPNGVVAFESTGPYSLLIYKVFIK
ncbi:MAG: hypothetical protein ACFFD2_06820 [Promethearchaeota archaeon]